MPFLENAYLLAIEFNYFHGEERENILMGWVKEEVNLSNPEPLAELKNIVSDQNYSDTKYRLQ